LKNKFEKKSLAVVPVVVVAVAFENNFLEASTSRGPLRKASYQKDQFGFE